MTTTKRISIRIPIRQCCSTGPRYINNEVAVALYQFFCTFTNVSVASTNNFQVFSSALTWGFRPFAKTSLKAAKKRSPILLLHESQQGLAIFDVISAHVSKATFTTIASTSSSDQPSKTALQWLFFDNPPSSIVQL